MSPTPSSSWTAYVRANLPALGLDPDRENDIVEEIAQQMEQTFDAAREDGDDVAAAEARARAVVRDWQALGNEIVGAEQSRVERAARSAARPLIEEPRRGGRLIAEVWLDLRHGLRLLGRHRGFTAAAVLTLALTIGATTGIFSLVSAVLLAPLPFPDPDRIIGISEGVPEAGFPNVPFSPPDLIDFLSMQQSFESVAAYRNASVELSGEPESERVDIARISPALFAVLRVQPVLGRAFEPGDGTEGRSVAILSHRLWTRRFASDPAVVGRVVQLDRQPFEVVGVMPAEAEFPLAGLRYNGRPAAIFVPLEFTMLEKMARGGNFANSVVARLKPGVSLAAAQAEASAIATRIRDTYSPELLAMIKGAALQLPMSTLHSRMANTTRPILLVLLAAVVLLLLAGCANVGNLMLALDSGRRRELAVRASLGAGRGRLARQLMVESVLLAGLGGALGVALAAALIQLAPLALPEGTPRLHALSIDGRVLAFAALVSLATAVLFGLVPGWRSSRVDPAAALADASRGSSGRGGLRLRRGLTAAQCALAALLLVSAGLLGRSLFGLLSTPTGMRADDALTISTYLPPGGYADGPRVAAFYREAVERVAALPGVTHAGASMDRPLAPVERRAIVVEGRDPQTDSAPPVVVQSWITPGYLEALGIPLLQGRGFTAEDDERRDPVILINDRAARLWWSGVDPIGRRLQSGGAQRWFTVVGVVGDLREAGLDQEPQPHTYTPIAQVPAVSLAENVVGLFRSPSLVVSVNGNPRALGGMMRRSLQSLDPRLALTPAQVIRESVERTLDTRRFATVIVAVFALAALLIAAVGLHGVLAFGVAQRSREIGIRVALGATRARIVRQVAADGARLVAAGLTAGLLLALGVTGLMRSLLVGVSPVDPMTFTSVAIVVGAVGALALWLPARAAARIEPARTIRES